MTMAQSTEYWMALPDSIKSYFYGIASKSDGGHTAFEFFHTEIPDALKSDPDGIELLLDGGTVTVPVDTFERGRASTGTDTVEYELPDRDMSRIDAGVNGGDYTPDNVVLENASVNRARGGVDMTDAELDTATESLASDAELISDRIGSNVADVLHLLLKRLHPWTVRLLPLPNPPMGFWKPSWTVCCLSLLALNAHMVCGNPPNIWTLANALPLPLVRVDWALLPLPWLLPTLLVLPVWLHTVHTNWSPLVPNCGTVTPDKPGRLPTAFFFHVISFHIMTFIFDPMPLGNIVLLLCQTLTTLRLAFSIGA